MINDPIIVCAALLYEIPKVCDVLIVGPRHFDMVMYSQIDSYGLEEDRPLPTQGFIDQFGKFHNRKDAYKIAVKNGQIRRECGSASSQELFSENLY